MRSVVGAYALLFTLGSIVYLKLPLLEVDAGRFLDIRANFGCLRAVFVKYDFQPEELYKRLPHFLDKCMRRNWDGWLEHFEADGRSAAFVRLPAPLSHVPPAPSYLHDSRQCSIVHVTNHTGIALEAAMKEAHPECDVVKVDQHVVDTDPSQELRVRVVNSAFSVSRRRRVSAVDHYALTSMILATRHIDALYVDESVPPVDFADILDSIGHLQQFPVCQNPSCWKQ